MAVAPGYSSPSFDATSDVLPEDITGNQVRKKKNPYSTTDQLTPEDQTITPPSTLPQTLASTFDPYAGTSATPAATPSTSYNALGRSEGDDGRGGNDGGTGTTTTPGTGDGRTPGSTPPSGTGPADRPSQNYGFTSKSPAQALIDALNGNSGAPGSDAFNKIIAEYLSATALGGHDMGNGYTAGQYDAQRQKIYLPGHDIRFENGKWVDHPTGQGGDSGGNTGLDYNSLLEFLKQYGAGNDDLRNALKATVTGLLSKYAVDPTAEDPIIKNQVDAYHGVSQRALQDEQAAFAERAHQQGLGTGAYDAAIGNAILGKGREEGGFQAGLISQELQNRRGALSDALSKGTGLLSEGDQLALQSRISALDAALKEQGLNMSNQQFYDHLSAILAQNGMSLDQFLLSYFGGQ